MGNDNTAGKQDNKAARRQVEGKRVRRELLPNQSTELLTELHLLTRDGKLNADTLRKLKQVNHLVGLLTPALEDVWARHPSPVVVDVGSGNAYLGFVLYELFFKGSDKGELWNVEGRAELTARVQERAARLGFSRLHTETAHIDAAQYPERIHLVTALHSPSRCCTRPTTSPWCRAARPRSRSSCVRCMTTSMGPSRACGRTAGTGASSART
jgi:hypothetical protein